MGANGVSAITMRTRHKEFYERLKKSNKLAHMEHLRVQILLLCESGITNTAVSNDVGVSQNMVSKWRKRWLTGYEELLKLEDEEENHYLQSFIKDNQRSGTPKKFTLSEEKLIVALACGSPRDHGIEMTDWTMEMLCHTASLKGIVQSISTSQMSRLLKNTAVTTT